VVKLNNYDGIEKLVITLCNFGYSDLKKTVDVLSRYRISTNEFCDYVGDYMRDSELNLVNNGEPLDVCALAHDYVLGKARNKIEKQIGLDIVNDADYSVYGDYCGSLFDYTENGKQRLVEEICCADEEDREVMLNNHLIKMFFDDVDIFSDVTDCSQLVEGD
jgi:hypothetical protein